MTPPNLGIIFRAKVDTAIFSCRLCDPEEDDIKFYYTSRALAQHSTKVHKQPTTVIFECYDCDATFKSRPALLSHSCIKEFMPDEQARIPPLIDSAPSGTQIIDFAVISNTKSFVCPRCVTARFTDITHLQDHHVKQHYQHLRPVWSCPRQCGYRDIEKRAITEHLKYACNEDEDIEHDFAQEFCQGCDRLLSSSEMTTHLKQHPGLVDAMASNSWKLPFAGRDLEIIKEIIGTVGWDVNDIKQQLRQRQVWKHNNIIHTTISTLRTRQQQQQHSLSPTPTTNDTTNDTSDVHSTNSTPYNTPRLEPFRDLQRPPSPSQQIIGHKRSTADRSPQPDHQGRSRRALVDHHGSSSTSTAPATSAQHRTSAQSRQCSRHVHANTDDDSSHLPPISSTAASDAVRFLRDLDLPPPPSGRISPLTLNHEENRSTNPPSTVDESCDHEHVLEVTDVSTGAPANDDDSTQINSNGTSTAPAPATTTSSIEQQQQESQDHGNNNNDSASVDSWLLSDRPVNTLATEQASRIHEQVNREWDQLFEDPLSPEQPLDNGSSSKSFSSPPRQPFNRQRSASFDATFDQALIDMDVHRSPVSTRSHHRTRSVSPVISIPSPSLGDHHTHNPPPIDENNTAMEIDEPITPWRPTQQPREYISIDTLMRTRQSRRYLRVPLFKDKHSRLCFQAAIDELVERHLVQDDDDCDTIATKNNVFHDALYALIAEYTRPQPRNNHQGRTEDNGMRTMDDEAAITDRLNNERNSLSAGERRRLLRQRTAIREGRAATSLFHRYRHRAKQTFDSMINPNDVRQTCPISPDRLYTHFDTQYGSDSDTFTPPSIPRPTTHTTRSLGDFMDDDVEDVLKRFNKNSSPGFDGIPYKVWNMFKGLHRWLTCIYRRCYQLAWMPDHWKMSRTILLSKKGDPNDPGNWRPIALQNSTSKIYSAIIDRMLRRTLTDRIPYNQKGFMPTPGCIEHDFYIHAAIRKARRRNLSLYVCSYDLRDAFGSVSHTQIRAALEYAGLDDMSATRVMSMYDNISCYVHTDDGPTNIINLSKGTKQGDPASPFIFTLCMLELSHRLNQVQPRPQQLYHNHLLLADDLTIISHDPELFRRLHRIVVEFMDEHKLNVNASKTCFSATIAHSNQQRRTDPRMELRYHNERIPRIDLKDSWKYLGNSVGQQRNAIWADFHRLHDHIKRQLNIIGSSGLRIFQKHHALKTFILPQLEYYIRLNGLGPWQANRLGRTIRTCIRKYLQLPSSTSLAIYHLPIDNGGLGFYEPMDWASSTQVVHILGLLNSRDPAVQHMIREEISTLLQQRYHQPENNSNIDFPASHDECTDQHILSYLQGRYENLKKRRYKDTADPSANMPRCIQHVGCEVILEQAADGYTFSLRQDPSTNASGGNQRRRITAIGRLKRVCQAKLLEKWKAQPLQGQSASTLQHYMSNRWIRNDALHAAAYRFALKARFDMLPTHANKYRWRLGDSENCTHCRQREDIHHVLCFCTSQSSKVLQSERHNQLLNRLVKAARYNHPDARITTNQVPPLIDNTLQPPDLVILDEAQRKVFIADVTVTAQSTSNNQQARNGGTCIDHARQRKVDRYADIKRRYEEMGYSVDLTAFVLGDVGGTDGENTRQLRQLIRSRSHADRVHGWLICDVLRFGHRMWIRRCEHLSNRATNSSSSTTNVHSSSRNHRNSPTRPSNERHSHIQGHHNNRRTHQSPPATGSNTVPVSRSHPQRSSRSASRQATAANAVPLGRSRRNGDTRSQAH
ncbi:reverse transcriptase [Lichtheimia corymbifera JMRC:FSU:9682]|uniref:Reverse transcriptase n=1 Tax=Lichtheimia corymbifera JMRC:FSU:9682 TaxID=1263082 RepID=A0A068SFU8_9FUNG|nr:reverse transcriptase [Lichtheimia corymbifera JMRC:FSU:9682]